VRPLHAILLVVIRARWVVLIVHLRLVGDILHLRGLGLKLIYKNRNMVRGSSPDVQNQ
jgi:hypothetical protein